LSWQITMNRYPITLLLTVAFCMLLAMLFIAGWQGLSYSQRLESRMEDVIYKRWQNQRLTREAFHLSDENSRITLLVFLIDDPNEIQQLLVRRAANTQHITKLVNTIEPQLDTEKAKQLFASIKVTRAPYIDSYQQALALLLTNHKRDEARQMMLTTVRPNLIAYHDAWNTFDQYEVDEIDQAVIENKAEYAAGHRNFLLTLFLTNLIAGAIAIFTVMRMHLEIAKRHRAEQSLQEAHDQLELRVQERTSELEASNKELEAFCYSISHDLRAPLRHIDGFADLLIKHTTGRLDERGRYYLDIIANSARQMGALIDDLLTFSRMSRTEIKRGKVSTEPLVDEIMKSSLQLEPKKRHIVWKRGSLPEVKADPSLLQRVWMNLISNALKFSRPRDPAEIEIGCDDTAKSEVVFFVRDNGVGFDMLYADKLFGVFQRLHRAEDFEGTGIGLANVRRIISRLGGRTWAEGKKNEGATFFFSLPKAPIESKK